MGEMWKNDMPLVSIIIPTYNRSKLLRQAVASVLAQTYQKFELIIVDDGSTDDTKSVIEAIADDRIRYIWQENQQRCAARNTGIAAAQGEYLAFLDSDDLWLPRKLELQLSAIDRHPDISASHGRCVRMNQDFEFIYPHELYSCTGPEWVGDVRESLLLRNSFVSQGVVAHRRLFETVGGFDVSLPHSEDWDMWIRLSAITHFSIISEPVGIYRIHSGNRTNNPVSTLKGALIIIEKHSQYMTPVMKKIAELYSYSNHAARAAFLQLPEASIWLTEACNRAISLGERDIIRHSFVGHAIVGQNSLRDYQARAHELREWVGIANRQGGCEQEKAWLAAFWGAAAQACRGRGDNILAVRAALKALASGTPLDRGVISTCLHCMLALSTQLLTQKHTTRQEQEIRTFLSSLLSQC